jgi:ketosteroid isomerase-like protein
VSEEIVARLRSVYARWAKGELEAGEELFAEDACFYPMAEGRQALDQEGFRRFMRTFLAQWDDFSSEAVAMEDLGDKILVTERQHGTGKGSGIEIDQLFYVVWTFRGGLAVSVRWDSELAEAREAAAIEA